MLRIQTTIAICAALFFLAACSPKPSSDTTAADAGPAQSGELIQHADAGAPEPENATTLTIPAGQLIAVRLIDSVDTSRNYAGDTFRASLNSPITIDGRVVLPAGAQATMRLAHGEHSLELHLSTITYHGQPVRVSTADFATGKIFPSTVVQLHLNSPLQLTQVR